MDEMTETEALETSEAGTIEEAKSLVADGRYDVALVDVNLAGHPVDELAAALTQRNRPFAFVTGYGREALPRGFRDAVILGKPFGQEQLLATIEVLLYQGTGVVPLRQKSASGRSPHLSSLTPMTAASATPAHCEIRSSICNDETHSPPVLITSLIRSAMCT